MITQTIFEQWTQHDKPFTLSLLLCINLKLVWFGMAWVDCCEHELHEAGILGTWQINWPFSLSFSHRNSFRLQCQCLSVYSFVYLFLAFSAISKNICTNATQKTIAILLVRTVNLRAVMNGDDDWEKRVHNFPLLLLFAHTYTTATKLNIMIS